MIKSISRTVECPITKKNVLLTINFIEDSERGIKTSPKVEGCDSTKLCAVGVGNSFDWEKCPFHGK